MAHIQQGPLSLFGVFLIDYKSDTRLTNEGNYSAVVSVLGRVFPFNKEKGRQGEANACVCVCVCVKEMERGPQANRFTLADMTLIASYPDFELKCRA